MVCNDDDDCQNNEAVGKAITKKNQYDVSITCVLHLTRHIIVAAVCGYRTST